jgi:hypothetical protein
MSKKYNYPLLPFSVIEAAVSGDADAINKVIHHYTAYIARFSIRTIHDAEGNPHCVVDDETRRILENHLTAAILRFRLE